MNDIKYTWFGAYKQLESFKIKEKNLNIKEVKYLGYIMRNDGVEIMAIT